MKQKTVLLAGASGMVGGHLLNLLLIDENYARVYAVVRKPLQNNHPKLIQVTVDFDKLPSLKIDQPLDEVFCTLGTTIKTAGSRDAFRKVDKEYVVSLAKWCIKNGVPKFLVVSAMGADAGSGIFYNRVKGEMEFAVAALGIRQVCIFRPSLLMGKRSEKRKGERVAQVAMQTLSFLFSGPLLKYKGIDALQVAKAMIKQANEDFDGVRIVDSAAMQIANREL